MKDYSTKAKLDFCLENDIEFWKEIPGYNGIYSVSTFGRVRNNETGRIRKPGNNHTDGSGYLFISLCKKGEAKEFRIHRLVLETFVGPCPEGYEADHRDLVRTNNRLENLHWVTKSQNNRNKSTNRKVSQYDLDGNYIKTFDTIAEACEELKVNQVFGVIKNCCKGRTKTAYGYKWRYTDED